MKIIPFKASHFLLLRPQDAQSFVGQYIDQPEYGMALELSGPGFTGVVGGKVVGMAGIIHHWEGRAEAWCVLNAGMGGYLVDVTRAVRDFLANDPTRRIETVVRANFRQGLRWAQMLGMKEEGYMVSYLPTGEDAVRFVRIRGD